MLSSQKLLYIVVFGGSSIRIFPCNLSLTAHVLDAGFDMGSHHWILIPLPMVLRRILRPHDPPPGHSGSAEVQKPVWGGVGGI